jgi:hypothetical protein
VSVCRYVDSVELIEGVTIEPEDDSSERQF